MTTIKPYLSTGELEARYETAGDPIAKSHFHALWLLSKGHDLDEVAELLSFSTRWVYKLVATMRVVPIVSATNAPTTVLSRAS